MAGARALPDLVARIRVDSSGVDQAVSSLIGSLGKADLALAGVAAGIGLLIVGGKSMIDIAEKHEAAERGLEQAYHATGLQLSKYQDNIDEFIRTNRRYISDQAEVLDGYAKLTRSGLSQSEVQKDMNRALDLSALKHISLSDAVTVLDMAEHGRLKGLADLGITTVKYSDAQGNLVASSHDVAKAMAELDTKTKKGRETLTALQQDSNTLSNDWQNLSQKGGPVLVTLLDTVVKGVGKVYDAFDRLGKDDGLWAGISGRLSAIAGWIRDWIIIPLQKLYNLGLSPTDPGYGTVFQTTQQSAETAKALSNFGSRSAREGRAGGGAVVPGRTYTVGETEEESLVMYPGGGGAVIPSGNGRRNRGDTFIFHQVQTDPWQTANEIAWAKKTRRL